MNRNNMPASGILEKNAQGPVLSGDDGTDLFPDGAIWEGYLLHWKGRRLWGRMLPERDYRTGKGIVLLWPREEDNGDEPFVELYYNERLTRYIMSFLGHIAINVSGEVFNFSHLLNECEVMTPPEYLYRPAMGPFAPSPSGRADLSDPDRPYMDKFGRNFMRTIHVLRITGRDTRSLSRYLHDRLSDIHGTPVDPFRPQYYRDFNMFTRNCATIIRDGLRDWGYPAVKGIFPRDMFTCAQWVFLNDAGKRGDITTTSFTMPQLMVPEAPPSAMTPLVNPANRIRRRKLETGNTGR